jgi:glycine dehydrogenase subunit 1
MDVANASMYDGPTACAEAALMACRLNNRRKVVMSETINPEYSQVTKTYAEACDLAYQTMPEKNGLADPSLLKNDDQIACVVVQYPNYFGCLEDLGTLAQAAHDAGALLIVISDPIALAVLKAPAEFGADIVVGDAQACGNYLSFGGPSAGYMSTRKEFVRQLPGRLAGKTLDIEGRTAYTLTLQTREQHIRRAKATSNICTNQALNALAMLVYLTALGPQGLSEVATLSYQKAHYLAEELTKIEGVKLVFDAPFFNEFAITTEKPAEEVLALLAKQNILGGISLSSGDKPIKNGILIATTELNDRAQLDLYVTALKNLLSAKITKEGSRAKSVEAESVSIIAFDKASSAVK